MFVKNYFYLDKRSNRILTFVNYASSFDIYFFMSIEDGILIPFFKNEIKYIVNLGE